MEETKEVEMSTRQGGGGAKKRETVLENQKVETF